MRSMPFVLLASLSVACGGPPPPGKAAAAGPRRAHLDITRCTPAGYGFECLAEIDGTPATLEACIGSDDKLGLTPRLHPPLALTVAVLAAPDTARYCGILILPAGDHLRIVSVEN
ncbi:MAG TPA: hypothetical protein VH142_24710 [Polyangiaceae bacterium]|nr:hypothetical protein [Polyangiaceae bacterium]